MSVETSLTIIAAVQLFWCAAASVCCVVALRRFWPYIRAARGMADDFSQLTESDR